MDYWMFIEAVVDFAVPVMLAAAGCGLVYWGRRNYRKAAARQCPHCGYDMRETPGLICPECGKFGRSQKEIEHGRVSLWKVVLGGVMVAPCVWMMFWVAAAGIGVMFEGDSPKMMAGEYPAGKGAWEQEVGEELKVVVEVEEAGWGGETNAVSRWVMPRLRKMVGVATALDRVSWTSLEDELAAKEAEAIFDSRRGTLQTAFDENIYMACCVFEEKRLAWPKFVVHTWVNPLRHFEWYFKEPEMAYAVRVFVADKAGNAERPQTPVKMPEDVARRLAKLRGMVSLSVLNVECGDALVEAAGLDVRLKEVTLTDVTADAGVVEKMLRRMELVRTLSLRLKRPVTDEELMAVNLGRTLTYWRIEWDGEAKLREATMMRWVNADAVNAPELSGRAVLDGYEAMFASLRKSAHGLPWGIGLTLVIRHDKASGKVDPGADAVALENRGPTVLVVRE